MTYIAHYDPDSSKRVIRERATMAEPDATDFSWGNVNRVRNYEQHIASLKEYPAPWLTPADDQREMTEGMDFEFCQNCSGHGYHIELDWEMECCGNPLPTGSCCNKPKQVKRQSQKECVCCKTSGIVPLTPSPDTPGEEGGAYLFNKEDMDKVQLDIDEVNKGSIVDRSKLLGIQSIGNDELCDIVQNTCQLIAGFKQDALDGNYWSEWDESVYQSLIELLRKLQPVYGKLNPTNR